MKIKYLLTALSIANVIFITSIIKVKAQVTDSVTNNNNENVEIRVQESGSTNQGQGQTSNGNTSEVNVTDNESEDNFWTNSYRGRLSIPSGNASLSCGEQVISFSRSGGFGLGAGAAGFNFSDNSGSLPEEFDLSLAEIRQCAKAKNTAEIIDKYVKLIKVDKAIANTYLRTVSPEIYATFFVENSKDKAEILSPKVFDSLSDNLRNEEFEQIVEWQDNFHGTGLAEDRLEFEESQKLRSIERNKRLTELDVLELERKAREVEAIIKQRQADLNNLLDNYQENR